MISDQGLVVVEMVGSPYTSLPTSRENAEIYIAGHSAPPEKWRILPIQTCRCCGEPAWENLRCTKHQGRNPCAVEGCKRTVSAPPDGTLADDQAICGEHWRRYVPPRSLLRRAYNRHIQRARRYGWSAKSYAAWERFWTLLVKQVRRRAEGGHLDQAEIERLFGWVDDG